MSIIQRSLATFVMAESLYGVAGEAFRAAITGESSGAKISITIGCNNVTVRNISIAAVSFGVLYVSSQSIARKMDDAVQSALGGRREDQGDPDVKPGSLHVQLDCYTERRFLEVLADYESGRMKTRFQEEFSRREIEVEELTVEIENMAEMDKTRKAIKKRMAPDQSTKNVKPDSGKYLRYYPMESQRNRDYKYLAFLLQTL